MADAISFVLNLVDRMSAPAKAMAASLGAVNEQLLAIKSTLGGLGGLKLPKVGELPSPARKAKEQIGQQLGPTRKQAEQAARYREQQEIKAAKAAERAQIAASKAAQREEQKRVKELEKAQARAAKEAERAQVRAARESARAAKRATAAVAGSGVAGIPGGGGLFSKLGEAAGPVAEVLGPIGIALGAVAVAAGVAGGAVAYLGGKLGLLAIDASDAKGDLLDLLDTMLGTRDAANEVYSSIIDLQRTTAASQEQLEGVVQQLSIAGVTSTRQLLDSAKSIAQAESVLRGSGERIQGIIERATAAGKFEVAAKKLRGTGVQIPALYAEIGKRTGKSVKEVEAQMKAGKVSVSVGIDALNAVVSQKFGKLAERQALDLQPQMARLHNNFTRLFADIDAEPFLKALSKIVAIFDDATPAGHALHDVITSVFNKGFELASRFIPYVTTALRGLIIIGLRIAIALRPLFKGLQGLGQDVAGPDALAAAMSRFGVAIQDAIGETIAFVQKARAFVDSSRVMQAALWLVGFGFRSVVGAIKFAINAIEGILSVNAYIAGLYAKWQLAGIQLVDGLIGGITGAASGLYDAVSDLASGALDKFKEMFGIHSPSKVMFGMGGNLDVGLARGISAHAEAPRAAMATVGAATSSGLYTGLTQLRYIPQNDNARPTTEAPRLSDRGRSGSGGSVTVQMAAGALVMNGVAGMEQVREEMPQMLADWWEAAALQNGTSGN